MVYFQYQKPLQLDRHVHCLWFGPNYFGIYLSDANLTGTLERLDFASFPNLTEFKLRKNSLCGLIPICHWRELQYLQFLQQQSNWHYSTSSWFSSKGMVPLDLGANYLETPDWSRFKSMPLLSHLCFYYNNLKLEFPSFIIPHCLNLTFLDLSLNQSTAPIP